MLTIVCFGDLWVSKVIVSFLQQLDLKNKYKPKVQLYRFGVNGLTHSILTAEQGFFYPLQILGLSFQFVISNRDWHVGMTSLFRQDMHINKNDIIKNMNENNPIVCTIY